MASTSQKKIERNTVVVHTLHPKQTHHRKHKETTQTPVRKTLACYILDASGPDRLPSHYCCTCDKSFATMKLLLTSRVRVQDKRVIWRSEITYIWRGCELPRTCRQTPHTVYNSAVHPFSHSLDTVFEFFVVVQLACHRKKVGFLSWPY